MFNFIKVKDNVWLNINNISSIEYYPDGDGISDCIYGYYLLIYTASESYEYNNKEEALGIIELLRQHGVFLE